ncbi:OprO/OprP family phosphate-selective porin [Microbulbifer sp. OS29]|uniref:OprO/OprP family phosphate-selective porin n=1 Tax=Microbulbifer okhotskensis TaxID=2926617 RepID=A0A9X2J7H5_9GAMM|nr:porin [Microbulbifer okhotskensis]MCO1335775.1 OprO/OprP family phosphate-selective porin [Microbulbifer okhotskensis]
MKRYGLQLALASIILSNPTIADIAETSGGLKIISEDGNFYAELGGIIFFDGYIFDKDDRFYSELDEDYFIFRDIDEPVNTTDFRAVRLIMKGRLWNWEYKLERDFSTPGTAGLLDVYLNTEIFNGKFITGNYKPSRSLGELIGQNDILMMERPFASDGIYFGRVRQQGLGWHTHWCCHTFGIDVFNLRNPGAPRNSGIGLASRFTWAPINDPISTLHLGASLSYENPNRFTLPRTAFVEYSGRRGLGQLIALSPGGDDLFFGEFGDEEFYLGSPEGKVHFTGLELAGTYGPFYLQSEYAFGNFSGDYFLSELTFEELFGAPPEFLCDPFFGCFIGDQDVRTWYITGSWAVTGEHKPYNEKRGVFKSIKPIPPAGALEITARFQSIENKDIYNMKASNFVFGFNYYFNPKVRVMLNVTLGNNRFLDDRTNQFAIRIHGFW